MPPLPLFRFTTRLGDEVRVFGDEEAVSGGEPTDDGMNSESEFVSVLSPLPLCPSAVSWVFGSSLPLLPTTVVGAGHEEAGGLVTFAFDSSSMFGWHFLLLSWKRKNLLVAV